MQVSFMIEDSVAHTNQTTVWEVWKNAELYTKIETCHTHYGTVDCKLDACWFP